MKNFLDATNCCGLRDLGFMGPKYTWLYQRANGSQIRERLDRALVSLEWGACFQVAKLFHLTCLTSNHSPLSLHFFMRPQN